MPVRVLVVDDDRRTAEALEVGLQSRGYTVALAHDGVEALEASESFEPQVVLLDLDMPRMNGFECARRLHERGDVPLVAISGFDRVSDIARTREAGFVTHLAKPLQLPAVVRALESAVAH